MKENKINIIQYKWAGSWGPFKIKIPCGECAVTQNIIEDVINTDFSEQKDLINFEVLDWLPNWFSLLIRGGWHAPIVTIDKKVVFQGRAIDRGFLASEIRKKVVNFSKIPSKGVFMFSKDKCKYCAQAKELLKSKKIEYTDKDVVKNPMATAEIFFHTKKFFQKNKPVTTPQIWVDGQYIGGAEELEVFLNNK